MFGYSLSMPGLSSCDPQSTTRISNNSRSLEFSSAARHRRNPGALSYEKISAVTLGLGASSSCRIAGDGSASIIGAAVFSMFRLLVAMGMALRSHTGVKPERLQLQWCVRGAGHLFGDQTIGRQQCDFGRGLFQGYRKRHGFG